MGSFHVLSQLSSNVQAVCDVSVAVVCKSKKIVDRILPPSLVALVSSVCILFSPLSLLLETE